MPSTQVGIHYGADTDTIYAIYHPDDDADLARPLVVVESGEQVHAVALTRTEFRSYATIEHLQVALRSARKPGRRVI